MADTKEQSTLSYNPALKRVYYRFPVAFALANAAPPADVLDRAKKKMEAEVKTKRLNGYSVFSELLDKVWAKIRASSSYPPDLVVQFPLTSGLPKITGLELRPATEANVVAHLTWHVVKDELPEIREKSFQHALSELALTKGLDSELHPGQIAGVYHRVLAGDKIVNFPLKAAPGARLKEKYKGKSYCFLASEDGEELYVVIFSIEAFAKADEFESLIRQGVEVGKRLKTDYTILKDLARHEIDAGLCGPERFGFGLPMTLFFGKKRKAGAPAAARPANPTAATVPGSSAPKATAGAAADAAKAKKSAEAKKSGDMKKSAIAHDDIDVPDNYPGRGIMQASVSADKTSCAVFKFRLSFYEDKSIIFDEVWIRREVKRLGFVPVGPDNMRRLMDNAKRHRDLNGLKLSDGKPAVPPTNPELQRVEEERKEEDVRQSQARNIVRKDQHVAEIVYRTPGAEGFDVYGKPIPIPKPEPFKVEVGANIKQKGEASFYATESGILTLEGPSLQLEKTYIHQGDVNLSSGNIEFDGPVVVEGSIDTGASLYAKGDVTITGDIRSGFVSCSGNLTVTGSIITSQKGCVRCKKNITCEFIENSMIYCTEEIRVNKAILSSTIYSNNNIVLQAGDGMIAGCVIYLWNEIKTGTLGYKAGKETLIYLGADWRYEMKANILGKRLERLQAALEKESGELKELNQRDKSHLAKKHEAQMETLTRRTERLQEIVNALQTRFDAIGTPPFNLDAIVRVEQNLEPTCRFIIKKKDLSSPQRQKTAVTAEKTQGSYFVALDQLKPNEEKTKKKK